MTEYSMIRANDKVLVALSGGKDSLTLLHYLQQLSTYTPDKFEIAAITVDYQNPNYRPEFLIPYLKKLKIEYHFVSEDIVGMAKKHMVKNSYTAFSSRIRRGIIYQTAREKGYNVVALAQHADDILISFLMSIMFEGKLQTMKSHYTVDKGDLRVIRPLCYVREKSIIDFANKNKLPIVSEEMPPGFQPARQRDNIKELLATIESASSHSAGSILKAIKPLLYKQ